MKTENLNSRLLEVLPSLRRFALALTRNVDEADDLVQETSVRVVQGGIPQDADLRRWAFRVCKNIWIDQLRRKKVRLGSVDTISGMEPGAHDGEAAVQVRSELDLVLKALGELPSEQQAALSLVALEGMSYKEVAEVMDTRIGTVMSRVSRARSRLADALADPQE